jgi:hypothetical protein
MSMKDIGILDGDLLAVHKKHKPNILLETISHFHFSYSHNMHNNLL